MRGGSAGGSTPDVDATMVQTLPELVRTFNRLRGARSYAELDNAVNRRLADGPRALPASTLSNLLNGTSVPTRNTVVRFLTACGLDEQAQRPWLAAWERVSTNHLRRPPGAVRVREARPRLLGVHAAIQVDQDSGELPAYVPRDLDADLRTAITASERGGFVLLVGGSSVGKTRALFEAVRAVLPEWWLVHPADTDEIREFRLAPTPRTVLWLDDLQRYLNQPGGLPAGSVRALVAAGGVVAATVWPDEYSARVASRQSGRPDPYAKDREVFGIAEVVAVADRFSAAERRRAEALAADRRIRVALDTTDAGFTQVLAAGPDLVRWWEQAPADQCYGKALITAALDALRAGAVAPLPRDYFAAAAPGYLTPAAQATAAPDWLDQGLAYATTWLHGAAATLTPVPAGMGQIAGYTVADYLHQHAPCLYAAPPPSRTAPGKPSSTTIIPTTPCNWPATPSAAADPPRPNACTAKPSRPGTHPPLTSWLICSHSRAASRNSGNAPTPATGRPLMSWPTCSPTRAASRNCRHTPTPAMDRPPTSSPTCSSSKAASTRPSPRSANRASPTTGAPPNGWRTFSPRRAASRTPSPCSGKPWTPANGSSPSP